MTEHVECVVIGAGVVGLAIGRAMALAGHETVVLEATATFGTATSARNSEVIHAGLYYPRTSLKATLCVRGRQLLYEYCDRRDVPHRRCGKLIVATNRGEIPALTALEAAGRANGIAELRLLEEAEVCRLEPELRCLAALWSPVTGIIDSHGLMLAMLADLEAAGGTLLVDSPVRGGTCRGGLRLEVGHVHYTEIEASIVINSAGLDAQRLAGRLEGMPTHAIPTLHLAKGNYFAAHGRAPFARLIYPVPQEGGLGVHLTLDLQGRARFGPDVEWIDAVSYNVDPTRAGAFYPEIRKYWPGLPDEALQPAYCGIRPKLNGPGAPSRDFMIQGPAEHGVRGLINLFGIESPGLTAALAIAEVVQGLV